MRKAILEFLFCQPWIARAWQNDSFSIAGRKRSNRYRPNGLPDIMGFFRSGRALFIETKLKETGGRTRDDQAEFLAVAKKSGCFSLEAWSLLEVKKALEKEGYLVKWI